MLPPLPFLADSQVLSLHGDPVRSPSLLPLGNGRSIHSMQKPRSGPHRPRTVAGSDREYAYGPAEGLPDTKVGTFTQDLYNEAKKDGWIVISMKGKLVPPATSPSCQTCLSER